MKKILHLVWNSHIDPVWQWDWDEGAAAALSTFYAACELLDKYDFVFCHNEALLYEYIEKYDPKLFKRIETFVAEGKWKIMGGWYVQPDCLVPSGESFIRQISVGREYFGEKFNTRPTTAMNFDSFGHTRGLPQILKKCGFDSYIFCRPLYQLTPMLKKDLPTGPFLWEGYDGSTVKTLRYIDREANYTARLGHLREDILRKINYYKDADIAPILWGVGNHGGLNSAQDLEDILVLKDEKKGEWEIIHSTLEDYFNSVNPTIKDNRQFTDLIKSYSSVHAIKLAHDQLENALYFTEKVCTVADIAGKYSYNKEILKDAERILCQIEFHDVLAGTSVKSGTLSSIRKAHQAIESLKGEMFAAYYALSKDLPAVPPGDDNNVFLNPYPYDYEGLVECEIYPPIFLRDVFKEEYHIELFDLNNQPVEFQMIKEESHIAVQHRVRLLFKAHIPAFSVTSYRAHVSYRKKEIVDKTFDDDIVIKDEIKEVVISKKTGLIASYKHQGKEILKDAFVPMSFDDNADPWGWRLHDLTCSTFNENGWPQPEEKNSLKAFKLDKRQPNFEKGLSILEKGALLTEVQALFFQKNSRMIVNYKVYKNTPYIDINCHVLWGEQNKGLKIKFPINGSKSYFAQMAFGIEKYPNDGVENPSNRYVGNLLNGEEALVIYNRSGIHSSSKKGKNLYLTLLNGACYCAHPTLPELPLVPNDRYTPSVEQGAHDFALRIGVNKIEECERMANEFNQPVYVVNSYPHGDGKNITKDVVKLSNQNVVITGMKKRVDGTYFIRLYNGTFKKTSTKLTILDQEKEIILGKFEFKTLVFDGQTIKESKDASIY